MIVDKGRKAAEVHKPASDRHIGIDIAALQDFAKVMKSLQDRALADAVWAKQQGDRLQIDGLALTDAFEILYSIRLKRMTTSKRTPKGTLRQAFE